VVPISQAKTGSDDAIAAMSVGLLFDYLTVRLNGPKAGGRSISIGFTLTDTAEEYLLKAENGVLNNFAGKWESTPDAALTLTRTALNDVLLQKSTMQEKISAGEIVIEGNPEKLVELFGLMDDFDPWFNIVTP
jgi:alkyl sulfatase BDS1-like metallo-beta-lactamase superfamily hydrolase